MIMNYKKNKFKAWGHERTPFPLLNQKGMTLIEIMIVISIIALIGSFVGNTVMKKYAEAQAQSTKTQMKGLQMVLDDFKRVCNFYPSTEQGLEALVSKPTGGRECKNYDSDGFIKKVPRDAWGNDFEYTSDGGKYTLKSYGPTGANHGEGGEDPKGMISTDDPNF